MNKTKLFFVAAGVALLGVACTPGTIKTNPDGGVWVSTSKADTWDHRVTIFEDKVSRKTIGNVDVSELLFSPNDSRKIFAITKKNGLWVSWNGGYNWDLILPNTTVVDIVIHPNNTKRIYAAVGGNIALTEDEGVRWRSTYTSDDPRVTITSLVLNPENPSILYAATSLGDILISEDNGINWRVHAELENQLVLSRMEFHPNQQNTVYALASGKGLARSRDSGENWELFTEAFKEYSDSSDHRDFVLTPSGILYASKFGLLRSLNHGRDWTSLPLISGKRDANIHSLVVHPDDPLEIFYGTRFTVYHSVDGGFNWIPRQLPTTRAASALAINKETPGVLYMGVERLP
jgi:photosystem II stability/assembly factor-like uncharacterized protein